MPKRNTPILLTDEQMKKFIAEGFLILKTDFSVEFHQNLVAQLNDVYQNEGNPGNNLLPRIRDLQKVFDHPTVTGALTSVLGPNYMLHAHRHGHFNASPTAGGWHKDSYWGYNKMRHHHPWWAMIMYFPQDTPVNLGPTSVMPGTHLYENRLFESDGAESEALANGQAGTFALIHYDIWHRSTPNILDQPRYMLKFEFMRTEAPAVPSWDNQELHWSTPTSIDLPIARHELIWEETWNWLSGQIGSLADTAPADQEKINELNGSLYDIVESTSLEAAYALARFGPPGIEALLQGLQHPSITVSRSAAYGLSVSGTKAIEGLVAALDSSREETIIHAIFALGENRVLASSAVPDLCELLSSSSAPIRQAVAETLGMIGSPVGETVAGLIQCLQDPDVQVRFMAGLALCRLGASAQPAIAQLEIALEDENRYVRAHAAEALHYIGSEQAKDVLIKFLFSSRWCQTTTPANSFYP
jgi:hypothetical protein